MGCIGTCSLAGEINFVRDYNFQDMGETIEREMSTGDPTKIGHYPRE